MAFQQGLSGLNTSARALDVVSNNIANAATVGFKGGQAQFSNVYAAALGVGGGSQVGIGAAMSAVQQQFSQGNISNSNNPLDIAVNGSGFFRLQKNASDETITYSRNGQFHLDSKGYVVNAQSNNLTGYQIIDGVVNRAKMVPVQLDTTGSPPQATGASSTNPGVKVQMNFDDRDLKSINSDAPNQLYGWSQNTSFPPNNLNTFNYSTSLTVYDQKGNDHALSMYFTRLDNSDGASPARDLWQVHFVLDDQDITSTIVPATNTSGTGRIPLVQFESDGTIKKGDFNSTSTTGIVTTSTTDMLSGSTYDLNQLDFLPSFNYIGTSPSGTYPSVSEVTITDTAGNAHTFLPLAEADLDSVTYAGSPYYSIDSSGVMHFDTAYMAANSLSGQEITVVSSNGPAAFFTDYNFNIDTSQFTIPTLPIAPDATNATLYPLGEADPAYTADLTSYNTAMTDYNAAMTALGTLVSSLPTVPVGPDATDTVTYPAGAADPAYIAAVAVYEADVTTYNNAVANVGGLAKFSNIFGTDASGNPLKIPVDFNGSTMFGSGYDANKITQDGYPYGRLSGVAVSSDGILRGNYSNGQTKDIAQLVLVDFISPVGLMNLGNNQWQETAASGQPLVGDPGTGSRGLLQSAAVEDANIDLTQELVNLITFQRNYQANAQSIKTQDQVMQTIVNLR